MHESMIEEKLKDESKELCKICEALEGAVKSQVERGLKQADTKEMGEVVDMIKDMYEAKEKLYKACYYKMLMETMEGDKEERKKEKERMELEERMMSQYEGQGGRGQHMGWEEPMRMYYPVQGSRSGGGNSGGDSGQGGRYTGGDGDSDGRGGSRRGSGNSGNGSGGRGGSGSSSGRGGRGGNSGSRYGFSFDNYMETRDMYSANDPDQKQMRMESLNRDLDELVDMAKEVAQGLSPEEKQVWKSKISKVINA